MALITYEQWLAAIPLRAYQEGYVDDRLVYRLGRSLLKGYTFDDSLAGGAVPQLLAQYNAQVVKMFGHL
jgi:hypothetical protein